jgi:hypothetical protein
MEASTPNCAQRVRVTVQSAEARTSRKKSLWFVKWPRDEIDPDRQVGLHRTGQARTCVGIALRMSISNL